MLASLLLLVSSLADLGTFPVPVFFPLFPHVVSLWHDSACATVAPHPVLDYLEVQSGTIAALAIPAETSPGKLLELCLFFGLRTPQGWFLHWLPARTSPLLGVTCRRIEPAAWVA